MFKKVVQYIEYNCERVWLFNNGSNTRKVFKNYNQCLKKYKKEAVKFSPRDKKEKKSHDCFTDFHYLLPISGNRRGS